MSEFKLEMEIKDNSSFEHKPRVFFTCHPKDFPKCFELIRNDLFRSHNCVIYYTKSMDEKIEEKDLDQMNLFIIPVTFDLLSSPSRTMDFDFIYAKKKNIPILPIIMERVINAKFKSLYNSKFGDLQYLERFVCDKTAISYDNKIKKHLDSVLISAELIIKIQKAFDAYIFLSYRKKDRHYANKLMKLIHSYPRYRDIAIWYDEFLKPGESFEDNIRKMLKKSNLYALLVTPNILEYIDGKPNYVMEPEYRYAIEENLEILPIEMKKTNKDDLLLNYRNLPDCVSSEDDEQLRARLTKTFSKIAFSENKDDKEHNFLIGLAYLEGIDVEVDSSRALTLITGAAEAGLPEAMEKLSLIYIDGKSVSRDYHKASIWAERLFEYNRQNYGEEDTKTCESMFLLAKVYGKQGKRKDACILSEKVYNIYLKTYGEQNEKTLEVLGDLAYRYSRLDDFSRACELFEKVYMIRRERLGIKDPDTIRSLNNLASTHKKLEHYKKAYELFKQTYELSCQVLGIEHYRTTRTIEKIKELEKHLKESNNLD